MSSVVPIHPIHPQPDVPIHPQPEATQEQKTSRNGVEARWGAALGKSFTPISRYFLHNAHRLKPAGMPNAKGLSPNETLVLIHLFDHQWDERYGYPSLATIADRMSLTRRQVRDIVAGLEQQKLLKRIPGPKGSTNRYDLAPLKTRLEEMMAGDVAATDAAELAKAGEV